MVSGCSDNARKYITSRYIVAFASRRRFRTEREQRAHSSPPAGPLCKAWNVWTVWSPMQPVLSGRFATFQRACCRIPDVSGAAPCPCRSRAVWLSINGRIAHRAQARPSAVRDPATSHVRCEDGKLEDANAQQAQPMGTNPVDAHGAQDAGRRHAQVERRRVQAALHRRDGRRGVDETVLLRSLTAPTRCSLDGNRQHGRPHRAARPGQDCHVHRLHDEHHEHDLRRARTVQHAQQRDVRHRAARTPDQQQRT